MHDLKSICSAFLLFFAQVQQETVAAGILQQLPGAADIVEPVMAEVQRRCTGHMVHLAESARALCALPSNKDLVVSLWELYLELTLKNAGGGALGSKHATAFTSERLKGHGARLRSFFNDDRNRDEVLVIAGQLRLERDLSGVYNLIDQVSGMNVFVGCRKGFGMAAKSLRGRIPSSAWRWHEGVYLS